jgi:hypothetical protein
MHDPITPPDFSYVPSWHSTTYPAPLEKPELQEKYLQKAAGVVVMRFPGVKVYPHGFPLTPGVGIVGTGA